MTNTEEIKPGIYEGVPETVYKAWPYPSPTAVKVLALGGTPAHYKAQVDGLLDYDSEARSFGRLAHMALLEPERLELLKPMPEGMRRAGKDWEALQMANPCIVWHSASEWAKVGPTVDEVRDLREAVLAHPVAGDLMKGLKTEVSVVWDDAASGLRCKGRLDGWNKKGNYILDVKTTSKNIPYQIVRAAYSYGYHVQSAMYSDAIYALTGIPPKFWFLFVEVDPPHLILLANGHSAYDERTSELDPLGYYKLGVEQYKDALKRIADCQRTGVWEGHPFEAMDFAIPKYAQWE